MEKYIVIVRDYNYYQPTDAYLFRMDRYYQSPVIELDYMKNYPDVGVLGTAYSVFPRAKEKVWNKFGFAEYLNSYALFHNSPFGHSTVMLRSSMIKELGIGYNKNFIWSIFIIIAMIVNVIIGLLSFPAGLILIALALAIGIPSLNKLSDQFEKPPVALSVCALIFLSPIAGILMLCIQEEQPPKGSYHRSSTRCEQCGITDYSVHPYTVDNYLGRVTRYLCPRCASALDTNTSPRGICEECRSNNPDLQFYTVTVGESKVNKRLCPACRARHDMQRRSINNNP